MSTMSVVSSADRRPARSPAPPLTLAEVCHLSALYRAHATVAARQGGPGSDGVRLDQFAEALPERLRELHRQLRDGTFQPAALRRVRIAKPQGGTRLLSIPSVGERIILEALRAALAPVVEPRLHRFAYAYRPGRSATRAVARLEELLHQSRPVVISADIKDFFDSIRLDLLRDRLQRLSMDPPLLAVLARFLEAQQTGSGRGIPQGSPLSPLLSNLYLTSFDEQVEDGGWELVRYCDNLALPTRDETEAGRAMQLVANGLRRLGLRLHPDKSRIVRLEQGLTFLGYRLLPGGRGPDPAAVRSLLQRLELLEQRIVEGRVTREHAVAAGRALVVGWAGYFGHAEPIRFGDGPVQRAAAACWAELAATAASPPGRSEAIPPAAPPDDWEGELTEELPLWEHGGDGAEVAAAEHSTATAEAPDLGTLRQQAEQQAMAGDYLAALATLSQVEEQEWGALTQGRTGPPLAPPSPAPEPPPPYEEEELDLCCARFAAGLVRFAEAAPGQSGTYESQLRLRPLGPGDLARHLEGSCSIAVPLRDGDGMCRLLVLDVDGLGHDGQPPAGEVIGLAHQHALELAHLLRGAGLDPLVEDSGGKGAHLWLFTEEPVPAKAACRFLEGLVAWLPAPPTGVRVERFPEGELAPDALQQQIKLPCGIHPGTGRRSRLLDEAGTPLTEPFVRLGTVRPIPRVAFLATAEPVEAGWTAAMQVAAPPLELGENQAARLLERCGVLGALAEKARATGTLDHHERTSLLYSLGHLGSEGRRAIHAILGRTANYDVAITERQIERLTGLPIGCARLREKHATTGALADRCSCDFGPVRGGYPTPLLHVRRFARRWTDVLLGRVDQAEQEQEEEPAEQPPPVEAAAPAAGVARSPATPSQQPPPAPAAPSTPALLEAIPWTELEGQTAPIRVQPHHWAGASPAEGERVRRPPGTVGAGIWVEPEPTGSVALYVTRQGAAVGLRGGHLEVRHEGEVRERLPVEQLVRVCLFGNVQLSTQAMAALLEQDADIGFYSASGHYRGRVVGPDSKNVLLRMAQHSRFHDPAYRLATGQAILRAKLEHARQFMQRFARNHAEVNLDEPIAVQAEMGRRLEQAQDPDELMGCEGAAAAGYFRGFASMVRPPFTFRERSRRPARDPVNALLNLGYTMLGDELAGLLEGAGFDAHVGFLHGIRYGRRSLALDLLEEHRTPVVDRLTLSLINRKVFNPEDFVETEELGVRLTLEGLRSYLHHYEGYLSGRDTPRTPSSVRVRLRRQVERLKQGLLAGVVYEPEELRL